MKSNSYIESTKKKRSIPIKLEVYLSSVVQDKGELLSLILNNRTLMNSEVYLCLKNKKGKWEQVDYE